MQNRFQEHPARTGVLVVCAFLLFLELCGHIAYRLKHGFFLWQMRAYTELSFYDLEHYLPNAPPGKDTGGLATDINGFVHNGYNRAISEDRGKYLIFLLGGSTVEGWGARNHETIAAQLERILNKRRPRRFRVVNAGYHMSVSYQEIGTLAGRIQQNYKPDMVIAFDGRNDAAYAAVLRNWKPNWQPYFDVGTTKINQWRYPPVLGTPIWAGFGYWPLRISSIAKFFYAVPYWLNLIPSTDPLSPDRNESPPEEIINEAVAAYFANHASAQARSKELGFDYWAALQPVLLPSLKRPLTEHERALLRAFDGKFPKPGIYIPAAESFYAKASKRGSGREWFYDLSHMFNGVREPIYIDDCHYFPLGDRIIAERMASIVLARIARRQSSSPKQVGLLPGHEHVGNP